MKLNEVQDENYLFSLLEQNKDIKEELQSLFIAAKLIGYKIDFKVTYMGKNNLVFLCNFKNGEKFLHFDLTFINFKLIEMCCCEVIYDDPNPHNRYNVNAIEKFKELL